VTSERTRAALVAAKARAWVHPPRDPAGAVERMRVARKAHAAQFAANVLPIIRDIQAAGYEPQRCRRAAQRTEGRHHKWWTVEACAGAADIKSDAASEGRRAVDRRPVAGRSATSHR
jgi:hypothetical protein